MFAVEMIDDATNKQLHSRSGREARSAWQLQTISRNEIFTEKTDVICINLKIGGKK